MPTTLRTPVPAHCRMTDSREPVRWARSTTPHALLAALLLACGVPVSAQPSAVGPPVLATAGSTRALALGDAYTALGADPDVIFYNPSQLVAARGIGIAVQRYERATTLLTVSAASVLAPGTVGVGLQLLDHATQDSGYEDLAARGEAGLFERGAWLATGVVGSLAYARPAFFNTRVGVTGKVVHQQFADVRDITGAFDIGVSRGSSFQLALVGRNLGRGIRIDPSSVALPRDVALGAAMPRREIGPLDLAATGQIARRANGTLLGGAGTEWSYMPLDGFTFALRVGYRAVEYAESHLTLGGGFVGERVSLDYAFQASDDAGAAHRVGVRWR